MNKLKSYQDILSENDYSFVNRVFSDGLDKYEQRLKAIEFQNLDHVLDAGCGFGQWALALAKLNKNVSATDISSIRLEVAKTLSDDEGLSNTQFKFATLEKQPFENEVFDAVFCYGAIFISDPRMVLSEFFRILKPGGKIYTNANGLGWSLNLWANEPNKTADYNPRINAAKAFQNTVDYFSGKPKGEGQLIIEQEQMIQLLNSAGFIDTICAGEGEIDLNGSNPVPFFKAEYMGFTGVYEVLSTKPQ